MRVLAVRGYLGQRGVMPSAGPRDLCLDPTKFGTRDVEWIEPGGDPDLVDDLMVAYFIHQSVLALRRTLAEKGMTQRELAEKLRVKEENLGRKMRGETWASLRDVLKWADQLGIDLLPEPGSSEDLFPGSR